MMDVIKTFGLCVTLSLTACVSGSASSPLLYAEPDVNAELTRAPRTLRLFFEALPDVDQSSLSLIGSQGELNLRGLHTMAADDLMIEILDPVTPGEYTVRWRTVLAGDSAVHEGSYQFSYQN